MIVKRTRIKIEKIKTYGNILEQKKKAFMYTTMQRVKFNDNCSWLVQALTRLLQVHKLELKFAVQIVSNKLKLVYFLRQEA